MLERIFLSVIGVFVIVFKWLAIVIAPALGMGVVGLFICDMRDVMNLQFIFSLMIFGAIVGVFWAEKIRRKHGLIEFDGRLIGHPDIDGPSKMKQD